MSKHHTSKHHEKMPAHHAFGSHGEKDGMAHESHHKMNKEHMGVTSAFSPGDEYEQGPASKGGAPTMASNESDCD